MPDYKEAPVSGTQWSRCNGIYISNPIGGQPVVNWQEETVVDVGGKRYVEVGVCLSAPFDPAQVIELRDPATGELTGQTATGMDVYAILFSGYMQAALARDAAAALAEQQAAAPGA